MLNAITPVDMSAGVSSPHTYDIHMARYQQTPCIQIQIQLMFVRSCVVEEFRGWWWVHTRADESQAALQRERARALSEKSEKSPPLKTRSVRVLARLGTRFGG